MDLALTESQEMLRTTARSFMEHEAPVDVVVGLQKAESSLDPDLWRKAARLGWLGIVLPAEYGGSGDSLSDAVRTGDGPGDVSLLHVDAKARGVTARRLPGFLSWQCEVSFDNVQVPASALLGEAQRGWAALAGALERAMPLLCAYIVGGCQAVYEKSVLYTQTRVQFGVPIGRFQRVQDHVVRLVNHLDSARWAPWEALWKLDTARPPP